MVGVSFGRVFISIKMKLVFTQFFLGVFLIINAVSSCSSKSAPQKLAVTTTSTTTKPLPRPHSSYDTVNLQPVVATGNSNAEVKKKTISHSFVGQLVKEVLRRDYCFRELGQFFLR